MLVCVISCALACVRVSVCFRVCACVRDLSLKESVGLGARVEGLKLRGLLHLRYLNALDILPQCLDMVEGLTLRGLLHLLYLK